jgi:hypothetical protein
MRPSLLLALLLLAIGILDVGLLLQSGQQRAAWPVRMASAGIATEALGLTDLCIATEARYTRHPAVSDPLAPFMDHPGGLEHFPTGSFWAYPWQHLRGASL